jgi:hypothetical protein
MERNLLIYQPDRPVDTDKRVYRVAWYGGESTQLHFQKWCLVATPNFDGDYQWIDISVRTLMEMPTRVKDMWLEMKDYYNYGVCERIEYLHSCIA